MLVQFGNNWMKKIPLTAKLDSACGLVQFWLSEEFFSSNYFQIGQHVVLLHILMFIHFFKLYLSLLILMSFLRRWWGKLFHSLMILTRPIPIVLGNF